MVKIFMNDNKNDLNDEIENFVLLNPDLEAVDTQTKMYRNGKKSKILVTIIFKNKFC